MADIAAGSLRSRRPFGVVEKLRGLVAALARQSSIDRASYYMMRLHRTNLEVRLRMIDEGTLQTETQRRIYQAVSEMLQAPLEGDAGLRGIEWDDIYKVERLIGLLLSGAELRQEIGARLQELADAGVPCGAVMRRDYDQLANPATGAEAPPDSALRAFLLRITETIQWNAKKKYLAQPIRKEATKNILYCVVISFLLVIAPYVILNFWDVKEIGPWWSLFALYTALTSGLLGAFFSRLVTVQRSFDVMTLDEVFLHRELSYTLLRAGVGMCGALIVYFFLRSEFIDGALFPKFPSVSIRYVKIDGPESVEMTFVMPSKDLALLTFWCFLAGFSEALVPSILASTERQVGQAGAVSAKSN